ncbi:hypothetical protein LIA77_07414 [Sarocladium implicatum]|nr:hypothetical protein LIA77_07414 [Sarocladium implicatum]
MTAQSLLILGMASIAVAQTATVSVLYVGNPRNLDVSASVIDVEDGQTTYSIACSPSGQRETCLGREGTMTQGPSTWIYDHSMSNDDRFETVNARCALNPDDDEAECDIQVTLSEGTFTYASETQTTRGYSEYLVAATVTAGADMLESDDSDDNNETGSSGTSSASAATNSAESDDDDDDDDDDDEGAAPRVSGRIMLAGGAAVMLGMLLV